jgi:hypothetical protein
VVSVGQLRHGATQEETMSYRCIIVAALSVLALAGPARADGLQPLEGRSIYLGALAGVAYYTVEGEGYHVVVTLAQGESGIPVRFESVLAVGQSVVVSTPREEGAAPLVVEIRRQGDEVVVYDATQVYPG